MRPTMAAGTHGWFGRMIDRLVGWLADHLLVRWDGAWAKRQRRRWRHRRAVYRATMRRLRARPRLRRAVGITESAVAASASALARLPPAARRGAAVAARLRRSVAVSPFGRACARLGVLIAPPLARFCRAHIDAWRWAAAVPGRLWGRLARGEAAATAEVATADPQPTRPTMPDGVLMHITCAACGHEVLGTNMRKYARYRCPMCKSQLLVLDCHKGVTMALRGDDRTRTSTQVEKNETEESEPVRA
jgi:DNA-directed RNA polymerase subunit RPC12/RpoP